MAHLIQIGNSKGVRIPKALIEQAELENKELELQIVKDGLLIKTVAKHREGWQEAISAALKENQDLIDEEWLEADLDAELTKL